MTCSRRRASLATAVLAGIVVPASALRAADVWDNSSGDADWFNPLNWADGTVPTSADAVSFPAGFPGGVATIDLADPSPADAQSLDLSDSYTFAGGSLRLANGGVNVLSGAMVRFNAPLLISTTNGLNKTAAGTLVLTTPVATPRFATVSSGTLRLESAGIISGATVLSGGFLELAATTLDQNVTLTSGSKFGGAGTSEMTGELRINGTAKVTLQSNDGILTIGDSPNDLTGGSSAYTAITGTGTVRLAQPSNVSTRWAITGGKLQISSDEQLGAATNDFHFNGAGSKLAVTDTFSMNRPIFMYAPGGTMDVASGKTLTLAAAVSGQSAATLTKTGGGRLVLQAASTRTGETHVNGGVVRLENSTALGSGPVMLNGPGQIEVADVAVDQPLTAGLRARITGFGNAAWTGPLTIAETGSLFLNGNTTGDVLTIGDGPVQLNGSEGSRVTISAGQFQGGTVALPYPSAYPGGWIITGQTARVGHPQAFGTGTIPIDVAFGGTLELMNSVTLVREIDLGGSAAVRSSGGLATVDGTVSVGAGAIFAINARLGTVAPADRLTINGALTGGSSNTTMRIDGPGTVALTQPGSIVTQAWDVESGTLRLDASGAIGGATTRLDVGGRALLNAPQTLGLLQIRPGGDVDLAPGGGNALSADLLAFNSQTSRLDIEDNAVVVRSSSFGVGTWSESGYAGGPGYTGASGLIQWGRNNGAWDRDGGITTSMPDAPTGLTSIGVATASEVFGIGQAETATWRGQTVVGDDTLIGYTYAGDATLDGKINIDDYGRIDGNVAQSGSVFGWFNGDFNYDGKINIDDYGIIDGNVNAQGAPFAAGAPSEMPATQRLTGIAAVPEPAGIGLIVGMITGVVGRRRRRRLR